MMLIREELERFMYKHAWSVRGDGDSEWIRFGEMDERDREMWIDEEIAESGWNIAFGFFRSEGQISVYDATLDRHVSFQPSVTAWDELVEMLEEDETLIEW